MAAASVPAIHGVGASAGEGTPDHTIDPRPFGKSNSGKAIFAPPYHAGNSAAFDVPFSIHLIDIALSAGYERGSNIGRTTLTPIERNQR